MRSLRCKANCTWSSDLQAEVFGEAKENTTVIVRCFYGHALNEQMKSRSEQSSRPLEADGELEMEAVGVAGSEVAESRGGVAERPATLTRTVACRAKAGTRESRRAEVNRQS